MKLENKTKNQNQNKNTTKLEKQNRKSESRMRDDLMRLSLRTWTNRNEIRKSGPKIKQMIK